MHKLNRATFQVKFGGKVFFIYSIQGANHKKTICNREVVEEIFKEADGRKDKTGD
jgi:hypothetical protein